MQDRRHERGRFERCRFWVVAVLKRRPREHPGRHRVDDFLGKRLEARAGLDVQAHGDGRGRVGPSGSLTANPSVRRGVVYLQDLHSNVYALALATGKLRWEYRCNQPVRSGPGPNGVALADGKVYGLTPTAAFALSATTGRPIWVNGHLLRKGQGTFGIQPQVANERLYLTSQYGSGPGGGVLLALNASSGAVLWRFNTVVGPRPGVRSLGLGSGGAWETPLVSGDESVTYGIGNPYQTPAAAIAHPGSTPTPTAT